MQRVQAPHLVAQRELRCTLHKALIDLDHAERRPLRTEGSQGGIAGGKPYRACRFEEPDATHEPPIRASHDLAQFVATRLADIALDESARIEIEIQRSASLSAKTKADALSAALTMRGGRSGRVPDGGVSRP